MKKIAGALCLATTLSLSALAQAREVTFTTTLNDYRGDGAYLALYITDPNGRYHETIWVAGQDREYYRHLRDWARGSRLRRSEFDGLTGASVGSGRTLKVTREVADALFDAGYEVRVDSAVEDRRDQRADAAVALTTDGAGQPAAGRGYVQSLRYDL